jgi:multidrug resistance efflux pump
MKITKSMLAAGAVTTVAIASLAGAGIASAHHGSSSGGSLEQRQETHSTREANRNTRLQELVDNGTISAEQKETLDAKHDEMEAAREQINNQDLTREQRREQMQQIRQDFSSWAKEQGIDLESIHPDGGPGNRPDKGMMRHGRN